MLDRLYSQLLEELYARGYADPVATVLSIADAVTSPAFGILVIILGLVIIRWQLR